MSLGRYRGHQRGLMRAVGAWLLLTGAISACGSRSGLELPATNEVDLPEFALAPAPDENSPPPEAELSAPTATIGPPPGCVDVTRYYTSSPPTVLLLIDQSASMRESFGESTRWEVLRQAIIDPEQGLLAWLDASASIGLIAYSSLDGYERGRECPITQRVDVRLGNAERIRRFYRAVEPLDGGDTPTADGIDVAVATLTSVQARPAQYVLLLTDGVPDTCAEPDPQNGFDAAVDAVLRARERGVFVRTVGVSPEIERRGLQRMANAAAGKPLDLEYGEDSDAEQPLYASTQPRELAAQLKGVIGDVRSCSIELGTDVDVRRARRGRLVLDGRELEYRGPDGWSFETTHSIELYGAACRSVLGSGERLQIELPCEAAPDLGLR
jgi:hypothetical protein